MLQQWLRNLGQLKLIPYQVHRLSAVFSHDSDRLKAVRLMSRHVLRPLQVRQVINIVKTFSFSSNKTKAALYYCRGVADPTNLHLLANQFTFTAEKTRIMRGCR
jgi:hypothetical protein